MDWKLQTAYSLILILYITQDLSRIIVLLFSKTFFYQLFPLNLSCYSTDFLSSLFYNTSARQERYEGDTSDTSPTWVQDKCDTSARPARHECYAKDTNATRVKNFDFDNDTSENIFSRPGISYMAYERLQGEKRFHSKNCLLEVPRSCPKMRLKSAQQKLNFVMAKVISKSYIKHSF